MTESLVKVKRFLRNLKHLPTSLRIVIAAFGFATMLFFAVVLRHGDVFAELSPVYSLYLVATYAAIPWAICAFIIQRNVLFLYMLLLECLAVLVGNLVSDAGVPEVLRHLHIAYATALVATLLMMVNKDLSFPFLLPTFRGWRRAPRFDVNQLVQLWTPWNEQPFQLMVQDCSVSGMALFGSEEELADLLGGLVIGQDVIVRHSMGRQNYQVPLEVMWLSSHSAIVKIGLMAIEPQGMAAFLTPWRRRNPWAVRAV